MEGPDKPRVSVRSLANAMCAMLTATMVKLGLVFTDPSRNELQHAVQMRVDGV